jgi:hypothetical protein
MIIKRNWRDAHPTIAHQSGVDWRLLSSAIKTSGDIEESALDPQYRCLKAITYVSFAKLQPRLSYINGTGKIKIGNEEARLRDGDIIYIPENTTHSIINDGEEMIDFLAFGGHTGKQKRKRTKKKK